MSVVHIDGSGPGKRPYATCAAVFTGPLGKLHSPIFVEQLGCVGPNIAEFSGLLLALRKAVEHGEKSLHVYSDSFVMVKQMHGRFKIKHPEIKRLHAEAQQLIAQLDRFEIQHVTRWNNRDADFYAAHGAPLQ